MASLDGRNEDAPFIESVYIALPRLPAWRSCMPKVRGSKFGYPRLNASTSLGHTHHTYELYYHESVLADARGDIGNLKNRIENLESTAQIDSEQITALWKTISSLQEAENKLKVELATRVQERDEALAEVKFQAKVASEHLAAFTATRAELATRVQERDEWQEHSKLKFDEVKKLRVEIEELKKVR